MKKHLSILLAIMMILGSFTTVFAAPLEGLEGPVKYEGSEIVSETDQNEEIRVIVELVDDPTITYANGEKYSELPESTRNRVENDLLTAQEAVKNDISSRGIEMDYINSFTVGFNGFSGTVKRDDVEAIKENPNVKNVYISNRYERPIVSPDISSSYEMIGNRNVWKDTGYNGEGMMVAIVDTGIDPEHQDMKITDKEKIELSEAKANELINSEKLPGKYINDKVPYGYNYFDLTNTIKENKRDSHGMHVAGTVGANGKIKGVAPEAQLLAMKVFSNDPDYPYTLEDIYMKAMEDAVKLGADSINLSLGSANSFYIPNNAMDKMITRLKVSGVTFAMAGGNEAQSAALNENKYPLFKNPDIGLVDEPGLNKDTISVASVENSGMSVKSMKVIIGDETKRFIYNPNWAAPSFVETFDDKQEMEVVYVGTGEPERYEGKDVEGKIVLAIRTGDYYYEKIKLTAQEKGVAGVLIGPHPDHDDYTNMNIGESESTIPMAALHKNEANDLAEELEKGNTVKVVFDNEDAQIPNSEGYTMSTFSGWGTTSTLDMKPEITAPGGNIYSTINDNSYTSRWGTSMATPHVAGGSALVHQYVRNDLNIPTNEESAFVKRLIMNTAEPIKEWECEGNYGEYSPRLQGAGLMKVDKAVKTPVTVVNKENEEAKVELRDFTDPNITMNLTAYNHSKEDVSYTIDTRVLTNAKGSWDGKEFNELWTQEVKGAVVGGDNDITVPGEGSKDITVTIDLSNATLDTNVFVEGYVYLKPEIDTIPQLVMPYVGFYGDWAGKNAPRILDDFAFGDDAFWGSTGFLGETNGESYYLGYDMEKEYDGWEERVAISPGNEGAYHNIKPVLDFMRNAEEVEYNILDERGRVAKKLYTIDWIVKNYDYNHSFSDYHTIWDGTINGEVVPDGKYYYQIRTLPQYKNAEWQEWKVPVVVDTKVPEISEIRYDETNKKLTWKANDEGIGLYYFEVYKVAKNEDTDELEEKYIDYVKVNKDGDEYSFDLSEEETFENVIVKAYDYAFNMSEASAYSTSKFKLESPEPFGLFGKNKVLVNGIAAGYKEVKVIITQDGEVVNEGIITVDQTTGTFSELIELDKDGMFRINVKTVDEDKKEIEQVPNRMFYVDTTAPEMVGLENNVVRSKYIEELSEEEALNSPMLLGGGRTVIFVEDGVGYAYDKQLIKGDILTRFENAEEKYVKLADGIFIDKNGKLTTNIPAVKYFEDKLVAIIKIHVKENFGEFDLFANDQYINTYDNWDKLAPAKFDDDIEFKLELPADTEIVEVKVVDGNGYEAAETIILNVDNPVDEEATINEIKDIEAEIIVNETYTLPKNVTAILSNGSVENKSVEWNVPEGVEIVEGKVIINGTGTYEFIANVEGYEVTLTLEVKPVDKSELDAKLAEAKEITDEGYILSLWTALQDEITKAEEVVAKEDVTQLEVKEALEALINAMENLKLNPLVEGIEAKYGTITDENENSTYVAYILFNLKEQYADKDIMVKVNDETFFERGADKEGYEFHFSGMVENVPEKIVLIIGEEEYDVSKLVKFDEVVDEEAVQQMIETYNSL